MTNRLRPPAHREPTRFDGIPKISGEWCLRLVEAVCWYLVLHVLEDAFWLWAATW